MRLQKLSGYIWFSIGILLCQISLASARELTIPNISNLLPEQTIKNIDFRRGDNGEGRLLLELSTPNTMVDIKEKEGKVILNFLNTKLPDALAKSYDVSDFATPVQKIDAKTRGTGVSISITPNSGNFNYSSYQSDGLLTVDFTPLTITEKEALLKDKFSYIGDKLSLNFRDIEVRSVLKILANFTGLNIIAADTVEGTVTLSLNDVPWDQALDLILKSKGLSKKQTGNVVWVATATEIVKIEEEELAVELAGPLITEYIQIHYARAIDIQALLIGSNTTESSTDSCQLESDVFERLNSTTEVVSDSTAGVLSTQGSSTVDSRTNMIIVKDTVKQVEEIKKMISILDVPVRQVMIEARVVIADTNFAQELGVKFGVAKYSNLGNGKRFSFGAGSTSGIPTAEIDPATGMIMDVGGGTFVQAVTGVAGEKGEYLVDLAARAINTHPAGVLGVTLARGADYVLNLELSALENENRGEVLANPRVLTSDRRCAYIKQGVQIPYASVSDDGTEIQLVDAVLELKVIPQITPDGNVVIALLIKKDEANTAGGIDKREIGTNVRIRDGETIVLGGVYESNSLNETYKIPFFSDLPIIGFLFTKKIKGDRKRELLIFITPKIVQDTLIAR